MIKPERKKEKKEVIVQFEPELLEREPLPARTTGDLFEEGITDDMADLGPSGSVGLPEVATKERIRREDDPTADHERLSSDTASRGNREAGDEGVSGGLAAGEGEEVDYELTHERRRGLGSGTGAGTDEPSETAKAGDGNDEEKKRLD